MINRDLIMIYGYKFKHGHMAMQYGFKLDEDGDKIINEDWDCLNYDKEQDIDLNGQFNFNKYPQLLCVEDVFCGEYELFGVPIAIQEDIARNDYKEVLIDSEDLRNLKTIFYSLVAENGWQVPSNIEPQLITIIDTH